MSEQGALSVFRRSTWFSSAWRVTFWTCSVVLLCGARSVRAQRPDSQAVATHEDGDGQGRRTAVLEHRISVTFDNVSLKHAIDSIAHVANQFVQYRLPLVQAYTAPVSLHAVNLPIGVALEHVLNGTKMRVIVDGQGEIAIVPLLEMAGSDSVPTTGTVNGRIVDSATGRGIGGATITVAGTKLSGVTSDSGRFTMRKVPSGEQTIVIRMFGYRSTRKVVQVASGEALMLRVALANAPNVLSGVVTTATGMQDRRTVGNDITVIKADSIMRTAPISSVTDLLENHVPGLIVTRSSGAPGAPSRIRLRGVGSGLTSGTNTSNDPIVIVDGARIYARESTARDRSLVDFPGTDSKTYASGVQAPSAIDQIDPNSIETIEILKGPSATSQWGADAGNGVIVITTKTGRAGPTRIDAAFDAGIQTMPGRYAQTGYYPFGRQSFASEALIYCGALGEHCVSRDTVVPFQGTTAARLSPFATGSTSKGTVTLWGGASSMTYALTASAGRELGDSKMPDLYQDLYVERYKTRPPSWMRRPLRYKTWAVNTSVGVVPMSGLHLTLQGALTNSLTRGTGGGTDNLAFLSGQYLDTLAIQQDTGGLPTYLASYTHQSILRTTVSTMTAIADWTRWSRFPANALVSVSTSDRVDQARVPFGYVVNYAEDTLGFYAVGHGNAVTRTSKAGMTLFRNALVSADVGVQAVNTTTDDFYGMRDTLPPGASVPPTFFQAYPSAFSSTTAGWSIEPRLNVGSRFWVTPGLRFDGGSASSGASRSGNGRDGILAFFPKLNFSWLAIDRDGQAPFAGAVTILRPRLAFGVAGVQPDPTWNRRLVVTNQAGRNAAINDAELTSIGNTQLHPERSHEVEGGFDLVLWGGRANLTASYYNKLRTDAIQNIGTAPSIGGGINYYVNIGQIRNTGTEIQFDARLIETRLFAWGVNMVVSTNRNLVTSLYKNVPTPVNPDNGTRIIQGYPIDGYWARPILGYHDNDGDGRISSSEVAIGDSAVYVGAPYPKADIPFGTDVSLWQGRVGIHMGFDYKNGMTQLNSGGSLLLANRFWNPQASLGEQAVAITALGCYVSSVSLSQLACNIATRYGMYQTVNLLRFSTLSLNATIPRSLSARIGVPNMTVALQGRNLGLWSNYRGKDPDVNGTPTGEALVDGGQIPQQREWSIRFTLGN